MRTPLDRSVRNLWDNYVEYNNVAKQLSYPRMISYREILRLSHKVYSQHQLESSLHCLQCMIREVLTAARSEELISRSSKEHPRKDISSSTLCTISELPQLLPENWMGKALHEWWCNQMLWNGTSWAIWDCEIIILNMQGCYKRPPRDNGKTTICLRKSSFMSRCSNLDLRRFLFWTEHSLEGVLLQNAEALLLFLFIAAQHGEYAVPPVWNLTFTKIKFQNRRNRKW